MEYNLDGTRYTDDLGRMANDAGILLGVESFLEGLPDTVRKNLTAGELADVILKMIRNIRDKRREKQ